MSTIDPALRVDDFDYLLPRELIAQSPPATREGARLMVVDRTSNVLHHRMVTDLPSLLRGGDVVVVNNTRVYPARLRAQRATGGRVEILLLRESDGGWEALVRPSRRLSVGERVEVAEVQSGRQSGLHLEIGEALEDGRRLVRVPDEVMSQLDQLGEMPLPPYITRRLDQPERYQTVFARELGSAAAPTAGLHLSETLIQELAANDIVVHEVTLHVGLDTFRPVQVERVADHRIHREWCEVRPEVGYALDQARRNGARVVAIGTTSARTLESLAQETDGDIAQGWSGWTSLFITPGYRFRLVDALLTNFHLPRSTLLMMISAFAGRELVMRSYAEAIAQRYRFFSFGDAQLFL